MEPEKDNKIKVMNVHTLTEDMAKVIENAEGGAIKKIIHEQEEQEVRKKNLSPTSIRNRNFVVFGSLFLLLAVGAIAGIIILRNKVNTVEIQPKFVPLIFTDKSTVKEIKGLSKENIAEIVKNELKLSDVKVDGIEGIYLTENKQPIGLRRFIQLIESSFLPDRLPLVNDNFLIGITNGIPEEGSASEKNLFILIRMRSFVDIFGSLQAWEGKMLHDLQGLFGVPVSPETNYLFTKGFEDGIIQNKNARILRDNSGKIVLMYVFADDNSVIITNSEVTTREIILRLSSSKVKQ